MTTAEGIEVNDEILEREDVVAVNAEVLDLEVDNSFFPNEWKVSRKGVPVGTLVFCPEGPNDRGGWLTTPETLHAHETLKEALVALAKSEGKVTKAKRKG